MEELAVLLIDDTTAEFSGNDETLDSALIVFVIDIESKGVTVLGILFNLLTVKTAELLPEATTKYMMKFMALWDSLAAMGHDLLSVHPCNLRRRKGTNEV